jgi:protein ImuB
MRGPPRRFVSVWLPRWPIERLARERPGAVPAEAPFALVASFGNRLVVTAVNRVAAAAGTRPGMALADARAAVPHLVSAPAQIEADAAALRALALWCGRYGARLDVTAPDVAAGEIAAADGFWVETTGVAHLFGSEADLLRDLCRRLAGFGITARPGLADTHGAAHAVARYLPGRRISTRILPVGGTADAIAALPVEGLRLSAGAARLLRRLGLRRIGDLYALPRASLERRFKSRQAAEAVLTRLDQALGVRQEPLAALDPPPEYVVRLPFSEPLISADGLAAALRRLVDDLAATLATAHRGARRLQLALYRADGTVAAIDAGLSRPSRQAGHFSSLLGARLETVDAGFGIDLMRLAAPLTEPLTASQVALRGDRMVAEERAGDLVDRLANRLGAGAVWRLEPRDSHLPERGQARRPALAAAVRAPAAAWPAAPGWRPPTLLPRPEPAEVVAEVPDGPPVRLRWRRHLLRVARAEGPERIAPEWWRSIGVGVPSRERDYYLLESEEGRRFWVFREGLYRQGEDAPRWFVHGWGG